MNDNQIFAVGGCAMIIMIIGMFIVNNYPESNNKLEAQKLLDFRNTDYSCDELKTFYLKHESKKYNTSNDLRWYWEVKDKLYENKCISSEKLQNIEFINTCMDGTSIGCEMSKLENPELYENFNFRTVINEAIKTSQ